MTNAERVKQVRARAQIRRWEFRQRRLAHGAWMRFRTALAMAEVLFAVDPDTWQALVDEGFRRDPGGEGLEPARKIVWITEQRARTLDRCRRLAPRLDSDLLEARYLALVPFAEIDP